MTKPIVAQAVVDVIWIFDRGTGKVEIVLDGNVLETCTLAEAPRRLAHHRNAASKGVARVDASPYRKHNRAAQ
jgi:hypothetical protein